MPCRDWYDDCRTVEVENPETKKRLDNVTELLCSSLTYLEKAQKLTYKRLMERINGLEGWWLKHKADDAKQLLIEQREIKKQNALKKLTSEERKLLGIWEN